eukprot:2609763-Rhodomonas_salina.1
MDPKNHANGRHNHANGRHNHANGRHNHANGPPNHASAQTFAPSVTDPKTSFSPKFDGGFRRLQQGRLCLYLTLLPPPTRPSSGSSSRAA